MRSICFTLALLLMLSAPISQADAQSSPEWQAKPRQFVPPAGGARLPPPLYGQADEIVDDASHNRTVLRGLVEFYFENHILTADEVTYQRWENRAIARGNVQLKDPKGTIIRADRMELNQAFRDAFVRALTKRDMCDNYSASWGCIITGRR